MTFDADDTVDLSAHAEALRAAVADVAKWQRLACTLAIQMRPILDATADSPEWHAAELTLNALDAEVARWIRATSLNNQENNQPKESNS